MHLVSSHFTTLRCGCVNAAIKRINSAQDEHMGKTDESDGW